MPGREARRKRHRALLLVSLILLVVNSLATRLSLSGAAQKAAPVLPVSARQGAGARPPVPGVPESAEEFANMTARQAFLIGKRLDVNQASWQEISALPGISDPVARRVVETRRRIGGFRSAQGLLAVPGIKEKRLKKILPFLANFGNK